MNAIITKFLALSVALAVLLTFSGPTQAASYAGEIARSIATVTPQTDDDDDDMSGGALAVLLLAVGGASGSGTFTTEGSPRKTSTLVLNPVSESQATVSHEKYRFGRKTTKTWTSMLDQSGTYKFIGNGVQWSGRTDGGYYPITGEPNADELAITPINARTVEFRSRKLGQPGLRGTISISTDGQSVTMTTSGARRTRQVVYSR